MCADTAAADHPSGRGSRPADAHASTNSGAERGGDHLLDGLDRSDLGVGALERDHGRLAVPGHRVPGRGGGDPAVPVHRDRLDAPAPTRVPVAGAQHRGVLDRRGEQEVPTACLPLQEAEHAEVHGVGAAGCEGHLVGADTQCLRHDRACVVQHQARLPALPVQAPRVGVAVLQGLGEHLPGRGVQGCARGMVEIDRPWGGARPDLRVLDAFAHGRKPTRALPVARGVASSRVPLSVAGQKYLVCLRKGSSVSLEHLMRFRRVALGGLVAVALLVLSGCSAEQEGEIRRLAMPKASSKEAVPIHDLWMGAWLAAILVGILVWGLIFYVAVRYYRRSETEIPVQTRYNLPIEIFYTIAPIMMVIVFFYFTVDTQNKVLHDDKDPDETITVVGQQWSWTFNYNLGYDKKAQKYEPVGSEEVVHEGGTTADRPTLWLVKDKSVKIYLTSPDVIHSFWVPAFLFKMDVVPGRDNNFVVTPTREGTFAGRCAELCGVYHSRMLFNVKVVDQAAYDAHLEQLAARGSTGPAIGGENADTTAGLEPAEDNGGE